MLSLKSVYTSIGRKCALNSLLFKEMPLQLHKPYGVKDPEALFQKLEKVPSCLHLLMVSFFSYPDF